MILFDHRADLVQRTIETRLEPRETRLGTSVLVAELFQLFLFVLESTTRLVQLFE